MINDTEIQEQLRSRFHNVEQVAEGVFRTAESYCERPFAIRYFDFTDHFLDHDFERYQEHLLAPSYFREDVPGHLRWNHYLYFVTNRAKDAALEKIRAKIEADRSYARKIILDQKGFERLLSRGGAVAPELEADSTPSWTPELDSENLGFILDESISIPEAVRRISEGHTGLAPTPTENVGLTGAERAACNHFLATLTLRGYRKYPLNRNFEFGKVNLVSGSNGVGKTSLFEAIEFLYAGGHLRTPARNASISGQLSGTELVLESTASIAALRQRNLSWYAKRDKKSSTLVQSFARFNYLDTDAAVRLSSDKDGESNKTRGAIARLVLGPEAEIIKERLRRIRERTELDIKEQMSAIQNTELRLRDVQKKLEFLRSLPKESDGHFESLRAALSELTWRNAISAKIDVPIEGLGKQLNAARAAAELLAQDGLSTRDIPQRAVYRSELQSDLEITGEIKQKIGSSAESLFSIEQRIAQENRIIDAIAELEVYARSGYSAIHSNRLTLAKDVAKREAKTRQVDLRDVDLSAYGGLSLASSIQTSRSEISRLRELHEQTAYEVRAVETALNASEVSRQRLLQAALQLLEIDPEHCPVCRTRFDPEELARKITAESDVADPQLTTLAKLNEELDRIAHQIGVAEHQEKALLQLITFLDGNKESTVVAAISVVNESVQQIDNEKLQLAEYDSQLSVLDSDGLSASRLESLIRSISVDHELGIAELQSLKAEVETSVNRALIDRDQALNTVSVQREQLAKIATRYELNADASAVEILDKIRSAVTKEEAYDQAAEVLASVLRESGNTQRLALQLKTAADDLASMSSALNGEEKAGSEIRATLEQVTHLEAMLSGYQTKRNRLSTALIPIAACSDRFESNEVANKVIAENAAEIARVFNAIHAPNDFTVRLADDDISIVRNGTQAVASIDEMSSGQRAAYALSLYFAMNSRLSSGPPLLLLDDPIAHVDDLNVLSFLDHLRDLVIDGKRQIFFSTASEKLAGLFRQKFRFMGEQDFRDIRIDRGD